MPDDTYDPSGPEENELEDDGTLDASDTLEGDPGDDPLDTGIAAPDRWSAGESFGTTLAEERQGESLDQLLAEDEGAHPDAEPDLVARDVGIDGGAAGAEEAAVHIQDEPGGATGG